MCAVRWSRRMRRPARLEGWLGGRSSCTDGDGNPRRSHCSSMIASRSLRTLTVVALELGALVAALTGCSATGGASPPPGATSGGAGGSVGAGGAAGTGGSQTGPQIVPGTLNLEGLRNITASCASPTRSGRAPSRMCCT